jgi:hypothetical protein
MNHWIRQIRWLDCWQWTSCELRTLMRSSEHSTGCEWLDERFMCGCCQTNADENSWSKTHQHYFVTCSFFVRSWTGKAEHQNIGWQLLSRNSSKVNLYPPEGVPWRKPQQPDGGILFAVGGNMMARSWMKCSQAKEEGTAPCGIYALHTSRL